MIDDQYSWIGKKKTFYSSSYGGGDGGGVYRSNVCVRVVIIESNELDNKADAWIFRR